MSDLFTDDRSTYVAYFNSEYRVASYLFAALIRKGELVKVEEENLEWFRKLLYEVAAHCGFYLSDNYRTPSVSDNSGWLVVFRIFMRNATKAGVFSEEDGVYIVNAPKLQSTCEKLAEKIKDISKEGVIEADRVFIDRERDIASFLEVGTHEIRGWLNLLALLGYAEHIPPQKERWVVK